MKEKIYLVITPTGKRYPFPQILIDAYDNQDAALQHVKYEATASLLDVEVKSVFKPKKEN